MESGLLLSLIAFAWISCFTPGPNNLLLTGAGARFGFWRTTQHMLGICGGLVLMLSIMACGVGVLFLQWPILQLILKVSGSAYLLYLAWSIANAGEPKLNSSKTSHRPWLFHQAALFQFMNPKAWLMSISAIGSFTLVGEQYWLSVFYVLLVFFCVCLKTSAVWTLFGVKLGSWLKTSTAWMIWNRSMGLLTAACVALIWFE